MTRKSHIISVAIALSVLIHSGVSPAQQPAASTDRWFLITLDGKPAGYEQLKTDPIVVNGERLVACYRRTRIQMKRLGQKIKLTASLWTQQTQDGRLRSLSIQRIDGDGNRIERSGIWNPERQVFRITERIAGSLQQSDIQTREPPRSPIASSWLTTVLAGTRSSATARVLFPESSDVVPINASKRRHRSMRFGDQRFEDVTEYRFVPQLDPARMTRIYCDRNNQPIRSEAGFLGGVLALEATTAEEALKGAKGDTLNLDVLALIPVSKPLSGSSNITETVLELKTKEGLLPPIPSTPWQQVELINGSTARLTLRTPDRKPRRNVAASFDSRENLIAASPWMPLNDPDLRRLTASAVSGRTDPTEICLKLEDLVRRKVRYSAFSTSLRPAPDVARTLRGDCTEHAILLAALIRTAGIPARVAGGLAHSSKQLGFSGHVWVEALIQDTWVPFDSSIPQQSRAVHHIKLTDSVLAESRDTGISLFLPLLDLAGQATITVISER